MNDIFGYDPYMVYAGIGAVAGGLMLAKSFEKKNDRNWMTLKDAKKYKLIGNEGTGIILGYHESGVLLSDASNKHCFVDGPTESGKTAGTVLDTLYTNTAYGVFLSDQSGDLWDLTSGIRSTYGPVYRIDPSEPNSSTYNPLDDILYSENMYAELQRFFRCLIIGDEKEQKSAKDPHWEEKAVELAPAICMHLLLGPDNDQKNIGSVLRFLRRGASAFDEMVSEARHPTCVSIARGMLADLPGAGSPYRNSVMQSLAVPLALWNDVNVDRITRTSSFLMDDLSCSEKPVTIYMTAPGSDAKRLQPLYRAIRDMSKAHLLYRSGVTLRGNRKTRRWLQIVDECQNERPPDLDDRLQVCRKYGERWLCGWQSLDAAEEIYGRAFLGHAKIKLSYRPTVGDNVVERLSRMSGRYEKRKVMETQSRKGGFWINTSRRIEKEWKPRMEEHDFEAWPEFGRCMLTRPGKPAILNVTDGKVDPRFAAYRLPPYELPPPQAILSPWYNDVPVPVEAPEDDPAIMMFREDEDEYDEVIV